MAAMRYEIWSEGYSATGNEAQAKFEGFSDGGSFENACFNLLKDRKDYDKSCNTLWGCRLFDSELDARKSFG